MRKIYFTYKPTKQYITHVEDTICKKKVHTFHYLYLMILLSHIKHYNKYLSLMKGEHNALHRTSIPTPNGSVHTTVGSNRWLLT